MGDIWLTCHEIMWDDTMEWIMMKMDENGT